MDQLWAPWRLANAVGPPPAAGCFVCNGLADSDDRANLIVRRTEHAVVVLNRFPYNNGHLLVCPNRHTPALEQLTPAEVADIHRTLCELISQLTAKMQPHGFNVGLNLGSAAGAGLPGHLHWHLVPRWNGDTNFMPVLADTKVIVQSLDALWQLLAEPR